MRRHLRFETCPLEAPIQERFFEASVPTPRGAGPYRPPLLAQHPDFMKYYEVMATRRRGFRQRLDLSALLSRLPIKKLPSR